uniref:Ribonuclease H1 n=1 Tax=Lygus hesperus TaxID=30085 RepID=A0A0A9YCY3_LYGHE
MFSFLLGQIPYSRLCIKLCNLNYLLIMPKYAVAVGHTPGIYDTWAECSAQVKGCKGAKFKKFNTAEEAQEFIDEHKGGRKRSYDQVDNDPMELTDPFMHFMAENLHPPSMMKVDKMSPSDGPTFAINSRLTMFEDKLNSFMDKTTKMFETLIARVAKLEGAIDQSAAADGGASKRVKTGRSDSAESIDVPEDSFKKDDKGFVIVFTDGACSSNGQQGAKAGIGVWFNDGHPLNVSAPVKGPPTNNTAEIQAARVAITQAAKAGIKRLSIHTDSKFVIDSITKWIHRWKKNDWKLKSGGPVKNRTEFVKLDDAIQLVEVVEWVYVRGHMGNVGNEKADMLAREGASQYNCTWRYADSVDGEDVEDNEENSS